MSDGRINFTTLADVLDALIDSIELAAQPKRTQRTVRNLVFQSRALRSVGGLDSGSYARPDWALGMQATIGVPLMTNTLLQRSAITVRQAEECERQAHNLASQLNAIAEGRLIEASFGPMGLNIQGHRGSRGLRPESTLPAFEVALDLMVTTLELDLHLTSDDQVVIWHDEELWAEKCSVAPDAPSSFSLPVAMRTLAVPDFDHFICDKNPDQDRFPEQSTEPTALAGNEFRVVPLSRLFEFVKQYEASPLKTDAQRRAAAKVQFNIETKRVEAHPEYIGDDFDGVTVGTFERVLIETIDAAGMMDRSTIQSFDFRSLRAIHASRPDIKLSALSEFVPDFASIVADGAAIWSPYYLLVTNENVNAAHDHGLEVLPWTVNEIEAMQSLIDMGVDGFITDRPDLGMRFV